MSFNNRTFGLDLLRASAIFFVVYTHAYNIIENSEYANLIPEKLYKLFVFDGVSMFFVLSGFLIGRILIKTVSDKEFNSRTLLNFWVRRWCRTLPNYFLVLSLLAIIPFFSTYFYSSPQDLLRYYTFSQNIASRHPSFFPEAWSLAVEEWFYLCIPIPLLFFTRIRGADHRRSLMLVIAFVIAVSTIIRLYRAYSGSYVGFSEWDSELRKQVVTRLDALMFGVLGAYLSLNHRKIWEANSNLFFGIGVILLLIDRLFRSGTICDTCSVFYRNYLTLSVCPVATLFILPKLSLVKTMSGTLSRVITLVSLTSYSMYLTNLSLIQGTLLPLLENRILPSLGYSHSYHAAILYVLYWALTFGVSYVIYRFYEIPMTDLREKIFSPRRSISGEAAQP